ncbi:HAD family hydrolase, partial [Staphylococcus epidermidis]|nr:HAD family hydrolase [Staphylococcus epidermidis]
MEWILFDKDGTLIEFDSSWEKIGVRLVDQLL